MSSDLFFVALGYNYKTRTDMSTYSRSFLSGFSLGAGINLRRFNVSLALCQVKRRFFLRIDFTSIAMAYVRPNTKHRKNVFCAPVPSGRRVDIAPANIITGKCMR